MFQKIFSISILLCSSLASPGSPIAHDTTSPNTFSFTSDNFYVDEDGSNAIVTVEFTPGDRSWSGWVNYSMSNGTATAGEDYTAVSGTLYFSGPGTPVPQIKIPIYKDDLIESDETIELFLWNTNAIITRSNATLVIRDKTPTPQLNISFGTNGMISLSWASQFSDYTLEKSTQILNPNWSEVSSPRTFSNGTCHVSDHCNRQPAFYRLKKPASP